MNKKKNGAAAPRRSRDADLELSALLLVRREGLKPVRVGSVVATLAMPAPGTLAQLAPMLPDLIPLLRDALGAGKAPCGCPDVSFPYAAPVPPPPAGEPAPAPVAST